MERYYTFNDVLDENGDVAKEKISDCTFAHLRPGDYVGVSFGGYNEDNNYHHGTVFAKVESVTMPKATGFFSGSPGQVRVSFPNGSVTDLLVHKRQYKSNWYLSPPYAPTKAVYQYFNNHCSPDRGGSVSTVVIAAYPSDRKALLKDAMEAEFARRKKRKEQLLLEQQKRREKELERERQEQLRREEEQRRNAAVSSEDIDNLFYNR